MKYRITFLLFLISFSFVSAQNADEQLIRRMADKILDATDFVLVDKDGKEYTRSKDVAVDDLRIKSPYLDWLYWNGLFNVGMLNLSEAVDDPRYAAYVHKAYTFAFEHAPYFTQQNEPLLKTEWWKSQQKPSLIQYCLLKELDHYGTMTAALVDVYKKENSGAHEKSPVFDEYKPHIEKAIKQLREGQLYLEDGTLARHWEFNKTLWIDDMYMMMSFLARYAALTENEEHFDFAAQQVILFQKNLLDPLTGLYYHGYYDDIKQPVKVNWGRANGWMFMGMAELLTRIPKTHKDRAELERIFNAYVVNIARYQSPIGLWHQVLDQEESYLETSCTAMFVFGIARGVNQGFLPPRYASIAEEGWQGLKTKIDAEGNLHGICVGTNMSPSIGYYYKRPALVNDIHGTGAFFKAAAEYLKMKKAK